MEPTILCKLSSWCAGNSQISRTCTTFKHMFRKFCLVVSSDYYPDNWLVLTSMNTLCEGVIERLEGGVAVLITFVLTSGWQNYRL